MTYIVRATLAVAATIVPASMAIGAAPQVMTNEGLPSEDPIMALAQQDQPRDAFTLNSNSDVELVRFKHDHLLSVCDAVAQRDQIGAARHAYPLVISYDGVRATVAPGSCFMFEAQQVHIRPGGDLPQNVVLTGTVKVIR